MYNEVVEIMWLESKVMKTSHEWFTELVATGASEDLNLGTVYKIKYDKKMHRVKLLKICE